MLSIELKAVVLVAPRQPLPVSLQAGAQCTRIRRSSGGSSNHHNISRRKLRRLPKRLTSKPLDSVAIHRPGRSLARDGQPKAGLPRHGSSSQDRKIPVGRTHRLFEHPREVRRPGQAMAAGESVVGAGASRRRVPGSSGRQTRAAFGTPSFDHRTSGLGRHSGPKAMRPFAF